MTLKDIQINKKRYCWQQTTCNFNSSSQTLNN